MVETVKNPMDALIKNSFVDKCLSLVPDDPVKQTQYIYFLTFLVFIGLMGYAVSSWANVITAFNFRGLFQAVFMSAIAILSVFGLKQARNSYKTVKSLFPQEKGSHSLENNNLKVESVSDMMEEFKK